MIRAATVEDTGTLATIYNHYIDNTIITFEYEPVTAADMCDRLQGVWAQGLPWLIAEDGDTLMGYAYATPWKARKAYQYSVEVSVYLDTTHCGAGWGSRLYRELFQRLADQSVHTVIGGISLPNAASVALHEKMGMVKAAHFKEVGFKFDRWIDVGYWQKSL